MQAHGQYADSTHINKNTVQTNMLLVPHSQRLPDNISFQVAFISFVSEFLTTGVSLFDISGDYVQSFPSPRERTKGKGVFQYYQHFFLIISCLPISLYWLMSINES